eukprot:SAG25_NODE_13160_length_270_cov_1.198830_1_plen_76_part_10
MSQTELNHTAVRADRRTRRTDRNAGGNVKFCELVIIRDMQPRQATTHQVTFATALKLCRSRGQDLASIGVQLHGRH